MLTESAWKILLQRSGFTGLDLCLRDSKDKKTHSVSMMVSTKQDQMAPSGPLPLQILYATPSQRGFCTALQTSLDSSFSRSTSISHLSEAVPDASMYIMVDSPENPLLGCLNEKQFLKLQELFESATGMLWVSFGGVSYASNPGTGSAIGFLRSLRSETKGVPYVSLTLDTESCTKKDQLNTIARILQLSSHTQENISIEPDFEYALQDGIISVPRLVEDEMANQNVRPPLTTETERQPLWQKGNSLALQMRQVGLLDSFFFATQNPINDALEDGEVEICVKSAGLNFKDVLIATGSLPAPLNLGLECAGTIIKVGKPEVGGVRAGDRVCAVVANAFATHVRTPARTVVKIPPSMEFSVAASLPTVFATAYFCIFVAAGLKSGEVILIHSATGGLGQACLKMAQLVGANIIATCGSQEKVDFLRETYGIPQNNILNSRSHRYEAEVMRLTRGKGVDVLINDQAGDGLREGWACMATFGRFVDVAKRDSIENASLPMGQFARGASYLPVPLDLYMDQRQDVMVNALKKGLDLVFEGKITPIEPIKTFKLSDVEKAFRFMQSGKHIGKIVLNMDDDDQVQVRFFVRPMISAETCC